MAELNEMSSYKRLTTDMQRILLELNIADDYHKAKKQIRSMEQDIEEKDRVEYDLKHELIASGIQLEDATKEIEELKSEVNELQKQIVKLETKVYHT